MIGDAPHDDVPAAGRVPTLTEVIDGPDAVGRADRPAAPSERSVDPVLRPIPWSPGMERRAAGRSDDPVAEHDDRIAQTLASALARIEADAHARLRDAMQPILADAADRLVAALRAELASSLRDLLVGASATDLATPPADRRRADSSYA